MPKALFAVFADPEPQASTSAPQSSISSHRRTPIDVDKENANDSAIAVTPRPVKSRTITTVNGKTPFSLASPPNAKEAAQQRLGLGMLESDGNVRGPAPTRAKSVKTIGKGSGRALSSQLKDEFAHDQPYEDAPVKVLAVVTEAYTQQSGFHYSPSASVRRSNSIALTLQSSRPHRSSSPTKLSVVTSSLCMS